MTTQAAVSHDEVALLELGNPEAASEARLAMVSLPVPLGAALPEGLDGLVTQAVDVGWWPDARSGGRRVPRRKLVFGMSEAELPATVRLGTPAAPAAHPPVQVETVITDSNYRNLLPHEVGELRLTMGDTTLGMRLGIRWRDELHWWQWLRLEKLWEGPVVTAYRVAGCIEVVPLKFEDFIGEHAHLPPNKAILRSKWLHNQNWLFGEAFLYVYANGVVQFTCRHVNNHRFDEGRELTDLVPLIGFNIEGAGPIDTALDATQARFSLGNVQLNLEDALPLVSAEHPGSLRTEDGLILYQPYEGVEIAGDHCGRVREDKFLVKAEERRIPKGVARSVRFNASLSTVAPVVSRLTVPEWWYAVGCDLWPDGVLSVHDSWDARINYTYESQIKDEHHGRFDEAALGDKWEGEVPYSQLLYFYRSGNLEHFRRAIRDAYHFADIAFDHSTETIRMHDYPLDGSVAPPLIRTLGLTFGYLETGDPYLLDCAESASSHWYWMDRHMWPRYAYGRDGAAIRGLVFLWDYLGKDDYATMAREAMGRLLQCQLPDGAYRDQGSGTGIHGGSHMPVKPWMANLATDPIIDYMERGGDDPQLREGFMKYIEFIMKTGHQADGSVRWHYQVRFGDSLYDPMLAYRGNGDPNDLPPEDNMPTAGTFMAHGHKARSLNLATRLTGDNRYFDTWVSFYNEWWAGSKDDHLHYHYFNKTLQHLPYAQAHAWNARWQDGALHIAPLLSDVRPELEGTIITPRGPVTLKVRRNATRDGWELVECQGAAGVTVNTC